MSTLVMEGGDVYCPLGKVRTSSGKMPPPEVSRVSSATDCTLDFVVIAARVLGMLATALWRRVGRVPGRCLPPELVV